MEKIFNNLATLGFKDFLRELKNIYPLSLHHNKGQVSIFIILGIIILLLLSILMYQGKLQFLNTSKQAFEKTLIEPEAEPVFAYVGDCIKTYAEEAIILAGQHGGYVNPNFRINQNNPTEAEAIQLSPESNMIIPYWWHLADKNTCEGNCEFRTHQPPLRNTKTSIATQLSTHIEKNLHICINKFEPFTKQGINVIERGLPKITTTITPTSVIFLAQYPLTIKTNEKEHLLDKYPVEIPVKLESIYNLASTLAELQVNNSYLEKHLRQLIDIYSGSEEQQLPPISNLEFSFSPAPTWRLATIREQIRNILSSYTPLLQVYDTATYQHIEAPPSITDITAYDRLYNRNMLIIASPNQEFREIKTRYTYLDWWQPYINIDGCNQETCTPELLLNTLITGVPYGIQRSFFSYDISYPVLVTLRDPEAFNGKGYTFTIALEANMRNNEPMPQKFTPLKMSQAPTTLICEPHLATSEEITITTINAQTQEHIDADIIYTCEESCFIGTTINGTLTTKLPRCIGGILTAQHSGYASRFQPLDTDNIATPTLLIQLNPEKQINLNLKRYRLFKQPQGWTLQQTPVSLDAEEEATILLTRLNNGFDEEFSTTATFLGDITADETYANHNNITLLPGDYEVTITTILRPYKPIIIPSQEYCTNEQCQNIPPQEIVFNTTDPLPLGGAQYRFSITASSLANATSLTFYTIDPAIDAINEEDRRIEDLEPHTTIATYSTAYRRLLEPEFEP